MNEGNPVWRKGSGGLSYILNSDSSYIIPAKCSEMSIAYNAYLQKWTAVYFVPGGAGIIMRTADNLWGPYSAQEQLLKAGDFTAGIYAGHVHEKYMSNNGKTFYFLLSEWTPVYNVSVIEVNLK